MDIDYSYYGLTKNEAITRGIKVAEYLKVETPDFYNQCVYIPPELKDYIERFELVWPMPIEAKYAERREITEFIAFREILQNALDADQEVHGYDRISVRIEVNDLGTHVIDRGRGITWRAFPLGGSEKPCYSRGYFGEGLKIAGLRFGVLHHPVFIFTRREVYKMFYYHPSDTLVIVFGRSKKDVKGTYVLIYRWYLQKYLLRAIYVKKNPDLHELCTVKFDSPECNYEMPNTVYIDDSGRTKLYVRDIFVNYFDKMFGENAMFTYNLWWVELDPNRVNVKSTYQLDKQIAKVLYSCPKAMKIFIERGLKEKSYGGVRYYLFDPDTYEKSISFPILEEEDQSYGVVKLLVRKYGIDAYSNAGDLDAVSTVGHEGGTVLLVPWGLEGIFSNILPRASEFVISSIRELSDEAKEIDPARLPLRTRIHLRKYQFIAEFISRLSKGRKILVKPVIASRSFAKNNVVYLTVDTLQRGDNRVAIHEIAHAYGYFAYGDAPDVSENFERCLEFVGSEILEMASLEATSNILSRIMYGCINARLESLFATIVRAVNAEVNLKISKTVLEKEAPIVLIAFVTGGAKRVAQVVPINVHIADLGEETLEPPVEESYDRIVNAVCREILGVIRTLVEKPSRRIEELTSGSEVLKRYKLDDDVRRAIPYRQALSAFKEIVVLKYDIRNDEYVRFGEVVP